MKLKFHDFEVYPEWWCCVVSDEEDSYESSPYKFKFSEQEELKIKSKMRVYTSDNPEDYDALKNDLLTNVVSGYNIKRYDLIILKCIAIHFTPRQLAIVNELLMHPDRCTKSAEHMRISNYIRSKFTGCQAFQDLMDDSDKGLKDKEASFGMDIRETEVPFDTVNLTPLQKEQIIYYCKHDVYACHVQYVCMTKPYIDTKLALCRTYGLSEKQAYESTNAVLSGKVLSAERTHGTQILDPTIVIYQSELKAYLEKWVPADVLNHLLTKQAPLQKDMFENKVFMADGGLHSTYTTPKVGREQSKLYVEATDTHGLYNIDASSCYPSGMLFCGAMSRAIKAPKRFEELFKKRLDLKLKPKSEWTTQEKEFVAAAKLVLNTTYGAMGNKYLPLYDDYMRSKTCRVCQLILIAVAQALYNQVPGLKVIQTNTDGILVYCKRAHLDLVNTIIRDFENISKFIFEVEEDSKIWQLNVNNYIAQGIDGGLKLKGESFITEIWQRGTNRLRPLSNHIIAKAQIDFYTKGTNPVKMLLEHDNVADFCLTCTKGPTYYAMVQKNIDGDMKLGKVARVIATETEKYGVVKKQKMNGDLVKEDTCANCPPHTWVVNDALYNYHIEGPMNNRELVHKDGSRAKIDFVYYANELDRALDIVWYKMKNDKLELTNEFNLKGGK